MDRTQVNNEQKWIEFMLINKRKKKYFTKSFNKISVKEKFNFNCIYYLQSPTLYYFFT